MWVAYYKDGTDLSERGSDGKERLFGDIEQDKLSIFYLKDRNHDLSVNMTTGEFEVDGKALAFPGEYTDFRLIYFKRVRKEFRLDSTLLYEKKIHYLGWQCTYAGKNIKRYIGFDGDKLLIHFE